MIRIINRLIVFVVGAVFTAGGALALIEAISTWTNSGFVWIPGNRWLSTFESTPWSGPLVIFFSGAVAVFGLLMVLFELWPHPPRFVPYHADGLPGEWLLLRRSTEAHLARRISRQVPVDSITTRLRPHPLSWTLILSARAAESSRPLLREQAQAQLDALRAPSNSRIRIVTSSVAAEQ